MKKYDSFQKEIPASRVNIHLDVDRMGGQEKLELPLKLLVLGDFLHTDIDCSLQHRERIAVSTDSLPAIMQNANLSLHLQVENCIQKGEELQLDLRFTSMKDFHPTQIARQIPELQQILGARNLLRDLGSTLMGNRRFRRKLEEIVQTESAQKQLLGACHGACPDSQFSQLSQLSNGVHNREQQS
jgi:type VI secretion system protein ImpB